MNGNKRFCVSWYAIEKKNEQTCQLLLFILSMCVPNFRTFQNLKQKLTSILIQLHSSEPTNIILKNLISRDGKLNIYYAFQSFNSKFEL